MSWSDIDPFKNVSMEVANEVKPEQTLSGLVSIEIPTDDGRVISAYVHQGSRSVYPKLGKN